MKLIAEYTDQSLEVLTEAKSNGGKKYAIEGIFMQADRPNRNGRLYEKAVMEKALDKYIGEQVSKGRAVGELNHLKDRPLISIKFLTRSKALIGKAAMLWVRRLFWKLLWVRSYKVCLTVVST